MKIVKGERLYGIDTKLPGMVHAALVKCPIAGGTIVSVDDTAVRKLPGIIAVVPISSGQVPKGKNDAVAIVADSWWRAHKAREQREAKPLRRRRLAGVERLEHDADVEQRGGCERGTDAQEQHVAA